VRKLNCREWVPRIVDSIPKAGAAISPNVPNDLLSRDRSSGGNAEI